jgi:hypothetical protein
MQIDKINRATEINQLHNEFYQGLRTCLEKAIRIGGLLVEQKAELEYGEWIPWIKANLKFKTTQATRYMRCFRRRAQIENEASEPHFQKVKTIEDFARISAKPTKEEIEERKQRRQELNEKARKIAVERIKIEEAKKNLNQEEEEEEEGEVIEIDDIEVEPFVDEESEEEFQKTVEEHVKAVRTMLENERSGKHYLEMAELLWNHLTKGRTKEERKKMAKALMQILYKKYPQLMDESV